MSTSPIMAAPSKKWNVTIESSVHSDGRPAAVALVLRPKNEAIFDDRSLTQCLLLAKSGPIH